MSTIIWFVVLYFKKEIAIILYFINLILLKYWSKIIMKFSKKTKRNKRRLNTCLKSAIRIKQRKAKINYVINYKHINATNNKRCNK